MFGNPDPQQPPAQPEPEQAPPAQPAQPAPEPEHQADEPEATHTLQLANGDTVPSTGAIPTHVAVGDEMVPVVAAYPTEVNP